MEYKIATKDHINGVLELHSKYHIQSISEKDKKSGFVTTQLNTELLEELIEKENGLFVAMNKGTIVAYVMAASWDYCSKWPLFQFMINKLNEYEYAGLQLSKDNSYQYGPICIDADYRGQGILEQIFELAKKEMSKKYPILITFVNKNNPRSMNAHINKIGLDLVSEFEFNNNSYVQLACLTEKIRR